MKKLTATLAIALTTIATAHAAETTIVDYGQTTATTLFDLIWEYETKSSGGVTYAVITGVRDSGSAYISGSISVPTSVSETPNGTGYIVKGIDSGTFANQIGITSVSIPLTVQTIGAGVFTGCTVLSEVVVDDGNPWFSSAAGVLYDKDHTKLLACPARTETILLPASLTEIEAEAFANCHRLMALDIPASVTKIGNLAFKDCTRLTSMSFEGNAPTADASTFQGTSESLVIYKKPDTSGWDSEPWTLLDVRNDEGEQPSGIVTAESGKVTWRYRVVNGEAELYNNGNAAIPTSTTQTYSYDAETFSWIGDGRLIIPSSLGGYPVTRIGDSAFSGCSALKEIEIPSTIRTIGDYAFAKCTGVSALSLPSGIQHIGYHPFSGSAITSLDLPDLLRTLSGNPLAGCDTSLSVSISPDNSYYTVINGVLYDKDGQTLVGCPARKESVSIVPTTTRIGPEAFDGCFRLRAILLPDSIASIGTNAFRDATRLASIVFPNSVGALEGPGIFDGCAALTFIGFAGNAPEVDPHLFEGAPTGLSVYVAQGTTGWKDGTSALPDSGKWPTDDAYGRSIANLDVSSEAELKEGDIFIGVVTNAAKQSTYTLKVLANRGVEILGISPKPIGDFSIPSDFESSLGTLTVKTLGDRLLANSIGLLSVTIPNSVTNIGEEVFKDCNVLASVTLAHGLRSIGRHPFDGTAIETIVLPDTVSAIDGNIFFGCNPSVSLSVGDNNPYFAESAEGALYDKGFTKLYAVPMTATELTVPETTTDIDDEAFAGCILLSRATFLGNAPAAADDIFADTPEQLKITVLAGSTGWDGDPESDNLPASGLWRDRAISADASASRNQVHDDGTVKWTYDIVKGKAVITGASGEAKTVTIPAMLGGYALSGVNADALDGLSGVKAYISESDLYKVKNGCLYSADGKTLLRVPDSLVLPYSVTTEISSSKVTVTIIPGLKDTGNQGNDGTSVTTNATSSSSSRTTKKIDGDISSETLLAGVTTIADHAFYGCNGNLTNEYTSTSKNLSGETGFIGAGGNAYVRTSKLETTTITTYDTTLAIPATVKTVGTKAIEGSGVVISKAGDTKKQEPGTVSANLRLPGSDASQLEESSRYIGWVEQNGKIVGTVTAKTGKARKGVVKTSGSVVKIGAKKTIIRNAADLANIDGLTLVKDLSASTSDAAIFNDFRGKSWTIAFMTAGNNAPLLDGYTTLSIAAQAKGKVRITGIAADGTRISASAQMVVDGDTFKIPVATQLYSGKRGGFATVFAVTEAGDLSVDGDSVDFTAIINGAPVHAALIPIASAPNGNALSGDISIWGAADDRYSLAENLGWKPRYTKSSGQFKGSVNLINNSNGKRVRSIVNGVVVDGVGYGTAVVKGVSSWKVEVR